jgi:type I restriction-modification system DNA methylase subunit
MPRIITGNAVIVTQDELGTNCWMPVRFLDRCRECFRYERCKYPEKKTDAVYDELLKQKSNLNRKLKAVRKEIARMSGKLDEI